MNDYYLFRVIEYIKTLLKEEYVWDRKTRELRYDDLKETIFRYRDAVWMDEIVFPKIFRAYRLCKAWGIFDEYTEWEYSKFDGAYTLFEGWMPTSLEVVECIQSRLSYEGFDNRGYFDRLWWTDEWQWQVPTRQECLDLNIRPNIVPAKVTKAGDVQLSLF